MKERPIIFSTDMVKAILEEKKTQTRRVLKPQPDLGQDPLDSYSRIEVGNYHPALVDKDGELYPGDEIFGAFTDDGEWGWKCPYGQVGDRLWVRETHYRYGHWVKNGITKTGRQRWSFRADRELRYFEDTPLAVQKGKRYYGWYKRPSIFMPRWASRIDDVITGVRVERVKEITVNDAVKEGYPLGCIENPEQLGMKQLEIASRMRLGWFQSLWDSINAKRGYGWEVNPFVWCISFKRIDK